MAELDLYQNSIKALKTHNLKVTKSRLEVLKILTESKKPLSHSDIMDKLDQSQNWDRVTIYRTLGEFEEKKIVKSLLSQDRVTYFELSDSLPDHAHFACLKCGKMECLKPSEYKFQFKGNINQVKSIEILIKGICDDCR